MFPNQPPPTSTTAAAGTSQTVTTTTTAQGATSVTLTPAVVGAANTAAMPETTAAQVLLPRAVQQGAQRAARRAPRREPQVRTRPYPQRAAPEAQTTTSLPQAVVTAAAAQGYQFASSATRQAASNATAFDSSIVNLLALPRVQQSSGLDPAASHSQQAGECSYQELKSFFAELRTRIGMSWNGQYSSIYGNAGGNLQRGAVLPSALSFARQNDSREISLELKELLQRVNAENEPVRRKFLLVKAMRAFSEERFLWSGALERFDFFLGTNWNSVTGWKHSYPRYPTATESGAPSNATLNLHLPADTLAWSEMVRLLQNRIHLQFTSSSVSATAQNVHSEVAVPQAEAEATPNSSTMEISFTDSFINEQEQELQRMMRSFNREGNEMKRNRLFAKIVSTFQEQEWMPLGLYLRVCEILNVRYRTVAKWLREYKARQRSAVRQGAAESIAPPSAVSALGATRQTQQAHTAATSSPPKTIQPSVSPVFSASTAPSSSATTTQLAPVLPPFTASAPPQSLGMTTLDDDDEVQVAPISPVFPGPFSPPAIDTSAYSTAQLDPSLQQATTTAPAPSLEELLALPIARDPSMEMDVDKILKDLDF